MTTILHYLILTFGQILAAGRSNLRLKPEHLFRHAFIAGGSGSGKSKLIELLIRQLVGLGIGFTYLDPHGDGAEAAMRYLAVHQVDPGRVHYLRPGIERCYSFDPFAHPPEGVCRRKYTAWLTATVERTVDAFLRNIPMADQESMKRLKRWLGNVLFAAGVQVEGKHLGISEALILTQPKSPHFTLVLDKVRSGLRPEVLSDFLDLAELRSDATRNTLLESTINCLRDVLSPATDLLFSQSAPSIDQKEVIRQSHFQIINLRKSDAFSRKQRSIVGGLHLNFLIHAAENLGEELALEDRVPHVLIIDEAENFIGEDLRMGFAELRKFKLCVVVAFQDLSCLQKGDLELQGKVVSQCGLQITFQQGNPDDLEYLGKSFGYGSLDLTPLFVDTVLPDGHEWADTESVSVGETQTRTETTSASETHSSSRTRSRTTSESIQRSVSQALSESHTEGRSESNTRGSGFSWSAGESRTDGVSESFIVSAQDGRTVTHTTSRSDANGESEQTGESAGAAHAQAHGESVQARAGSLLDARKTQNDTASDSQTNTASQSKGTNKSHSQTEGESAGVTHTDGITIGKAENHAAGTSASRGGSVSGADTRGTNTANTTGTAVTTSNGVGSAVAVGEGETTGESRGQTSGVALGTGHTATRTTGKTPLAKQKIVSRPTGSLVRSVMDQIAGLMNLIASLPDRVVMVKCKGLGAPFLMQVHEVLDPYEDAGKTRPQSWKDAELRAYIDAVQAAHPYYFTAADECEDRIARFLMTGDDEPRVIETGRHEPGAPNAGGTRPGSSGFIDG